MTQRRILLLGLLFLGLLAIGGAGWWWYSQLQPTPFGQPLKYVVQGARSSSGNFGVSAGNLVVAPKPGVLFGTVSKPGNQEQLAYLILFRYGRPGTNAKQGMNFSSTTDGRRSAETTVLLELDGKRIEAVYRIELNPELSTVANESLTIGGKSVDMTAGQVFLIDLTAESPVYQQKKVELPSIPSKLDSTADVEQLADAIQKRLANQDPEIKAFLR
jgi:hypothetical protein